MKKASVILITLLAFSKISYAQWSVDANNVIAVNTNTGNVGIGTSSPTDKLEVAGPIRSTYWHPTGSISDDFYVDVEPGTRTLRTRNWNTSSPNIGATGFHTGYAVFEGNVGIGTVNAQAVLDVGKLLGSGELGSVFARVLEGNTTGTGTFLGVRGYDTQATTANSDINSIKTFSIEHSFYGQINNSINFLRGGDRTGGSISFNTNNNVEKMRILYNGNVGIGVINPLEKLAVNGTIHSQEVKVDMNGWADYVFKKGYPLLPLSEVKTYIDKNQHLPDMPGEGEILKAGLNLGEMNKLLTKKVEELTLYLIDKDKNDRQQQLQISSQQAQIDLLKKQVEELILISGKNKK